MSFGMDLLQPALEFLQTIEPKPRATAFRAIDLLRQFGLTLPMPHSKRLRGHPLHDLRVRHGSTIVRLFCFMEADPVFVVTGGYLKKSDRTSQSEIEGAMRLRSTVFGSPDG